MTTSIGILWLDNNSSTSTGYICTGSTANDVRRISLSELPRQTIWLVNFQSHKFREFSLGDYGNIKNSKFLGFSLSQVAIDLNLTDDLNEKLPVLYQVASLFAHRIEKAYGIDLSECRFSVMSELQKKLIQPNFFASPDLNGHPSRELEKAVVNAIQKVQSVTYRPDRQRFKVVTGRFPRSPYFLTIVNQNYPTSHSFDVTQKFEGKIIGINQLGNMESDTLAVMEKLIDFSKSHAGIIQFKHNSISKKYQSAFPLGKEVVERATRTWATIPEIIDLANYNSITLGKCYFTSAGRLMNAPELPDSNEHFFLSYVNGLLNEVVWTSMCSDNSSAITAYMRAYDRILCRQKAQELVDQNYDLAGFSGGSIRCFIREGDDSEARRFTENLNRLKLIPQFSVLE